MKIGYKRLEKASRFTVDSPTGERVAVESRGTGVSLALTYALRATAEIGRFRYRVYDYETPVVEVQAREPGDAPSAHDEALVKVVRLSG